MSTKDTPERYWLGALEKRYDALLIANGTPPPKLLFDALQKRCTRLIALDGGVNTLKRWRTAPDHVIGDLDSAGRPVLAWAARHGAIVHSRPSQESSDFEKGLALCRKLRQSRILITAADGDAFDHVLHAMSMGSLARGLHLTFVSRRATAHVLKGRISISKRVPAGHSLSWFGLPEARGCTLEGVAWPFTNEKLQFGGFNSLSNLPDGSQVRLRQRSGASLLVIGLTSKPQTRLLLTD